MASDKEEEHYDVFIVHSSEDNEVAEKIDQGLTDKGLKTFAHYKDGTFQVGRRVFDNVLFAVSRSDIVLILLTQDALSSHWVTFEVLMGLEKSHRENAMCVRLVFQGVSEAERLGFKTGTLELIPDIVVDFSEDSWKDDLASKIKEKVTMRDILPAGNVAHGLVFNYYFGYLAYVLPATKEEIKNSEYYSVEANNFSQKFVIIIPASCKPKPIEGEFGEFLIEKMPKPLEMDFTHGDKKRKYNPTVYKITNTQTTESFFFLADIPFILATMSKMKELGFADIDLRFQVPRFRMTLRELVDHRNNPNCKNTSVIIPFEDNDAKASPAKDIWNALQEEFSDQKETASQSNVGSSEEELKDGTAPLSNVVSSEGEIKDGDQHVTATVTYKSDVDADRSLAEEIMNFLKKKNVKFSNGDAKMHFKDLGPSRWNIFVVSESAVKDVTMAMQFEAALAKSITENQVQVIPVLEQDSDINEIPHHFACTTLLKKEDPAYLEKLWKTLQAGDTKMVELLPAGVVYEGLAYSYLMNYLPFNLTGKTENGRDFKDRFDDGIKKYNGGCKCVYKLFVIVPASCSFPGPGTIFPNEEHLGPLEPVVIGFRKYFLQLYRLTLDNGKQVCYSREYATPAITLHEMTELKFSGLNDVEMKDQAWKFVKLSKEILENPLFNEKIGGNVGDKCEIVYFDDEMGQKKEQVTSVLEERLKECLK
ncbi:uncharacterized protein LOC123554293 [Mercenaria mercenaria]|uniref:uncharacterized protein LOC123554293 n=1 Tax=Mercenaria mercenaria TaxID=6596 RepID=UPI00234F48A1|nr:uncharacterized protein LOC123554293 [Mercenaria mercenaria]XP_045200275.2 uncharacterized protein LOC123554293 [Mercenaria mercenaria]XP_045200276.2 uncharacterized protein LOC123554293 [Mercenaria mercenaria]XP_045200277.2 uncharacterized protein LOC123554293 [Mercenaria mercenaria]XP_053404222.1 uncharacterized protein LOC123554293 [Mercenaria mercenaria]XP_053404223.1 uncharacterized protein LOC123554293 [Mercenaria mercenaria]